AAAATSGRAAADLFRGLPGVADDKPRLFDGLLLASSLIGLAAAQRELGQTEVALTTHTESLNQLQALLRQGNDVNVQHFHGRGLLERGRTLTELPERRPEAERDIGRAIEIWEQLQKPYPDAPLYREWSAVACEARA